MGKRPLMQILIGGDLLTESETIAVQQAIREKFVETGRYINLKDTHGDWIMRELSPVMVTMYLDLAKQLKRIDPVFPYQSDIDWDKDGNPFLTFDPFSNGRVRKVRYEP